LAVGVLVFGFVASTPARADFSVMRFEPSYRRIWWNNGINPIGTGGLASRRRRTSQAPGPRKTPQWRRASASNQRK